LLGASFEKFHDCVYHWVTAVSFVVKSTKLLVYSSLGSYWECHQDAVQDVLWHVPSLAVPMLGASHIASCSSICTQCAKPIVRGLPCISWGLSGVLTACACAAFSLCDLLAFFGQHHIGVLHPGVPAALPVASRAGECGQEHRSHHPHLHTARIRQVICSGREHGRHHCQGSGMNTVLQCI
jgi:hypothetical protein